MSTIYGLKLLALSTSQSYKDFFFSHNTQVTGFSANYKKTVGVDIFGSKCVINQNGEMVSLSIWDIASGLPEDLRELFYKGAAGCLIFCSPETLLSSHSLTPLLSNIRHLAENIPLFLILKRSDDSVIPIDLVEFYKEQNHLNGYFIIPDEINQVLGLVSRAIIYNQYYTSYSFMGFSKWIEKKEREFRKFKNTFKSCPCCDSLLHVSHLREFFFSIDDNKRALRKKLLFLMEKATQFDISTGIPCCSCFKEIFS